MAGEWVKMQIGLTKDPKVMAMTALLAAKPGFAQWAGLSPDALRSRNGTRNVTVRVTVVSLLNVWGQANLSGKADGDDLVVDFSNLGMLDDWAEQPDFGEAMAYVGWAVEEESGTGGKRVRFPKFMLNNVPMEERMNRQNADRQKRHRIKKRDSNVTSNADSNGESNVTRNVTVTHREEKRREEKKEENTPPPPKGARTRNDASKLPEIPPELNTPEFAEAWADWVQHRSERKPKMTPTAAKQAFAKLAAWGPVRSVAAIKHSIAGSYQGIFENTSGQKPGQSQGAAQPVTDLQAIAAKQREREREAALHAERAERDRLARGGNIFAKPRPEPEPPHSPPADEEESSACPF